MCQSGEVETEITSLLQEIGVRIMKMIKATAHSHVIPPGLQHVTPQPQHFTVSQNHSSHHPSYQGNLSSFEFLNRITLSHLTTRPN